MKKLFFSLLAVSTIILFSCNKDEVGSLISSEDVGIIMNDAATESVEETADYEIELFSGSTEMITEMSSTLKSTEEGPYRNRYRFGVPPSVTVEPNDGTFPKTITLDYGEGTELENGTVISGSIVIVVTAQPRTEGAERTVTFNQFYVDDVNISGTKTMTFTSSEESKKVTCVGDLVLTFEDETYIERHSEKVRELAAGYETPRDHSDDEMHISGFVNSTSSEGYAFGRTIVTPLVKKGECRFIVQGVVTMHRNDEVVAELNYGDGACDDIATITKDGEERQITLRQRRKIRNN